MIVDLARSIGRSVVDFALPPRCAGCGTIVAQVHDFCPDCWTGIDFLAQSGCITCGLPLEATDAEQCAACLAHRPRIARTRAAVAYDDISKHIAIRLKYGRKVALARTMARFIRLSTRTWGTDCSYRSRCIAGDCGTAASTSPR